MDVVRESIESLKGTISLANSEQGGAEIKLSLPLTLVSVPVLLVLENEQRFAIPSDDVNQIFYADEGSILPVAKGWIFRFGNQDFSIRTLSEMLGLVSANPNLQEQTDRPVLLIEHEQGSSAVLIDDAFERRDVVVQPLGEWLDYVKGVSGARILADGYVAPILELKTLFQHQVTKTVYQPNISLEQNAVTKVGEGIIVVDDSLSARRSLQIATEQLGYNVRSAIDGLDAIEKIEDLKPSVMLVDMEMPNMNGLEMVESLRVWTETKNIPIIMVTSRSTAKHRTLAAEAGVNDYLTKPVDSKTLQATIEKYEMSDNIKEG
jgi:chemosensory pili system protein ChpA (sensor histidine kinase/response regulator)